MSSSRVRVAVIAAIVLAVVVGALAVAGVFRADDETAAPVSQPTDQAQEFGAVGTSETVPCPGTRRRPSIGGE